MIFLDRDNFGFLWEGNARFLPLVEREIHIAWNPHRTSKSLGNFMRYWKLVEIFWDHH